MSLYLRVSAPVPSTFHVDLEWLFVCIPFDIFSFRLYLLSIFVVLGLEHTPGSESRCASIAWATVCENKVPEIKFSLRLSIFAEDSCIKFIQMLNFVSIARILELRTLADAFHPLPPEHVDWKMNETPVSMTTFYTFLNGVVHCIGQNASSCPVPHPHASTHTTAHHFSTHKWFSAACVRMWNSLLCYERKSNTIASRIATRFSIPRVDRQQLKYWIIQMLHQLSRRWAAGTGHWPDKKFINSVLVIWIKLVSEISASESNIFEGNTSNWCRELIKFASIINTHRTSY